MRRYFYVDKEGEDVLCSYGVSVGDNPLALSLGVSDNVWHKYEQTILKYWEAELQVLENVELELRKVIAKNNSQLRIEAEAILVYMDDLRAKIRGAKEHAATSAR
jgi:hypothetical protein